VSELRLKERGAGKRVSSREKFRRGKTRAGKFGEALWDGRKPLRQKEIQGKFRMGTTLIKETEKGKGALVFKKKKITSLDGEIRKKGRQSPKESDVLCKRPAIEQARRDQVPVRERNA